MVSFTLCSIKCRYESVWGLHWAPLDTVVGRKRVFANLDWPIVQLVAQLLCQLSCPNFGMFQLEDIKYHVL